MRMGEAMAAAVLLLILTALISAVNFLVLGKKVHYQ
jgi:ABC-type sugar transport system permease subunit